MEADMLSLQDQMPTDWAASAQVEYDPAAVEPQKWPLAVQVGIVVALIGILFASVLADMAHDWWTEPAWSQGMLLPPLALYIAWIQRSQILSCAVTPDQRGLFLTGFACMTYVLGQLASEFFLTRISFVILLVGLIWTFWGLGRLRRLVLPLLLLASMVPLPVMIYNSLAGPLQLLASDGATRIAQSVGVSGVPRWQRYSIGWRHLGSCRGM